VSAASGTARSTARVLLLAGASGSGKSFLAGRSGLPVVALDDFYRDADDPRVRRTAAGTVDWEAPESWDRAAAVSALVDLAVRGAAELPVYDLAADRRIGSRLVRVGGAPVIVAEGIFATHVIADCRAAGILIDALVLTRPRAVTAVRRFTRDVLEARKPVRVLIRRGWHLYCDERAVVADHRALGCRPVTARQLSAALLGHSRRANVSVPTSLAM
jgi:uridine kinase